MSANDERLDRDVLVTQEPDEIHLPYAKHDRRIAHRMANRLKCFAELQRLQLDLLEKRAR